MATSPATLLVVSHDRRLLETVCEKLWVVDSGSAVAFDGSYRAWRTAVAGGWTMAGALELEGARGRGGIRAGGHATAAPPGQAPDGRADHVGRAPRSPSVPADPGVPTRPAATKGKRREKLSKEAYRRQKAAVESELTRLGLRKNHLELAMGDPVIQGNFVEMRRVTSELADIDVALATAEDGWLDVEERAP